MEATTGKLLVRPATIQDAGTLNLLIRELAEFEHLLHETSVTEEDIIRDAFGENPKFRAIIAEYEGLPAGYAIMFDFYSTFRGRAGLFLEDLYVRPQYRNKGIGKAMLAYLAGIASRENYFYMRWQVLDWNKPAIDFYKSLGAVFLDEWKAVCLIGDPLQALAGKSDKPVPQKTASS
ncbi:MAG: GNAT family N-acetyltransferase [Candidatus Acidiferrales bacterium]